MGDEQQKQKKRSFRGRHHIRKDMGERIGTTIKLLHSTAITAQEMLALAGYKQDLDVKKIKNEVYKGVVRCLRVEDHENLMPMTWPCYNHSDYWRVY